VNGAAGCREGAGRELLPGRKAIPGPGNAVTLAGISALAPTVA
jgi:hypothetical protein